MKAKFFYVALTATLLAACASKSKHQPDVTSLLAPVKTIELRDETSPVLLASTEAKRIRNLVEVALKHRGYEVCEKCRADAIAIVNVNTFGTQQSFKRDWIGWGNLNQITYAQSEWTFEIMRDGQSLFNTVSDDEKAVPIEQLAGQQVQEVMQKIPRRN